MTDARTADPPFTARFVFSVDGLEIGRFTELSGLAVQLDVEDIVEGGQNQFKHRVPGRLTWPNLVLKRGITNTNELFKWITDCSGDGLAGQGNKVLRHNGKVELLSQNGERVRTWEFIDAFPVKWTGPRFAAASSDLAVEELEVCHCGISAK